MQPEPELDFAAELERFLVQAERTAFGPSTQAILDEAVSRDIPWLRLNQHSLVQLGQGVHQQRIRATMTSNTSALAIDIASDKELTNRLLSAAGLRCHGRTRCARRTRPSGPADRSAIPSCASRWTATTAAAWCSTSTTTTRCGRFPLAEDESRRGWVVVESFITGKDYRVLVIGGRMVALAERVPAHVIGDGVHTVSELVDETNADPRRGVGHEKVLTRIKVDDAAVALVADQGFAMDDVPPQGTTVKLTLTGNMSTGGISIDRTLEAHPDNIEIAEEAARVVGLDVAGIDFIAPDIAVPVREAGGAICEVNAAPGLPDAHPPDGR